MTQARATNGWRLAVGTWTIVPVRPPAALDKPVAAIAMGLGPFLGIAIGSVAAAVGAVIWHFGRSTYTTALLAAIATVTILAIATRGLHLDGLADTADGFGSGRSGAEGLDIMRRSDIGPFGVLTVLLVVGAQVVSVAGLWNVGAGWTFVIIAAVVGRLCAMLTTALFRPARNDGLGAVVIGALARWPAAAIALLCVAACVALASVGGARAAVAAAVGSTAAVLLTMTLAAWTTKRFGGVTGDTLGACVETGATCVLVMAALTIGA